MKRAALEKYLSQHGAGLMRHGAGHDRWRGPAGISTIPRHREIKPSLVRAICKQLGVPAPPNPN